MKKTICPPVHTANIVLLVSALILGTTPTALLAGTPPAPSDDAILMPPETTVDTTSSYTPPANLPSGSVMPESTVLTTPSGPPSADATTAGAPATGTAPTQAPAPTTMMTPMPAPIPPPTEPDYSPAGYARNYVWMGGSGSYGSFLISGNQTEPGKSGHFTAIENWILDPATNTWARASLYGTRTDLEEKGSPGDGVTTAGEYLHDEKLYGVTAAGESLMMHQYKKTELITRAITHNKIETLDIDWVKYYDGSGTMTAMSGHETYISNDNSPDERVFHREHKEWFSAKSESQWNVKQDDETVRKTVNGIVTLDKSKTESILRSYSSDTSMQESVLFHETITQRSSATGYRIAWGEKHYRTRNQYADSGSGMVLTGSSGEKRQSSLTWWPGGNVKHSGVSYKKEENGVVISKFIRVTDWYEAGETEKITVHAQTVGGVDTTVTFHPDGSPATAGIVPPPLFPPTPADIANTLRQLVEIERFRMQGSLATDYGYPSSIDLTNVV